MLVRPKVAQIWHSFRCLPLWLQYWVAVILMPVNACSVFMLDTFSGRAIALALLIVVATNVCLMWRHGGMNKDMSLVHLLAWLPLQVLLAGQLTGHWGDDILTQPAWALTVSVFMVNAVSLFFDVVDAWQWWRGDKATVGTGSAYRRHRPLH